MKKIQEITSFQDISSLILQGFERWREYGEVTSRMDAEGNLIIFDYLSTAGHKSPWNWFELHSRGVIFDLHTGELIARPFDKFFNLLEGGRRPHYEAHITHTTTKHDGSMGSIFYDPYLKKLRVATRGSFESPQAIWATNYLDTRVDGVTYRDIVKSITEYNLTPIVEIIYPENRVAVDYKGREDLILLAIRNYKTGNYLPFFPDVYEWAYKHNFDLTEFHNFNDLTAILEQTGNITNMEGWVVYFSDGNLFKIKGDEYLYLHKLIAGISFKNVLNAIRHNYLGKYMLEIPEEFRQDVQAYVDSIEVRKSEIEQEVQSLHETVLATVDYSLPKPRKQYALEAQRTMKRGLQKYKGILFNLFDDKDTDELIYDIILEEHKDDFKGENKNDDEDN